MDMNYTILENALDELARCKIAAQQSCHQSEMVFNTASLAFDSILLAMDIYASEFKKETLPAGIVITAP